MLIIEVAAGIVFAFWVLGAIASLADSPFVNDAGEWFGGLFWLVGVPALLIYWIF